MALLTTIFSKIKKLFFVLFSVLKKPFCCRKRNRRNSGHLLPMTVDKSNRNVESFSDYSANSASNVSRSQNQPNSQLSPNSVKSNVKTSNVSNNQLFNKVNDIESNELDIDFFSDMIPKFKKPKKIVLSTNESYENQRSNRFGVDTKATIFQTKELGVIEHYEEQASSWEDNADIEEMWDTDQTLRFMRQQEREKRIAEHQRIKMEKEFKRSKQPKGNLLATKIS